MANQPSAHLDKSDQSGSGANMPGLKSRLKPRLSQNLLTFWVPVQRLVVGVFSEKAVNLGERKSVVKLVLGS